MITMSIRPSKATVSIGIWRTALCVVYAAIAMQLLALTNIVVKEGSMAQFFAHEGRQFSQRAGRHTRSGGSMAPGQNDPVDQPMLILLSIALGTALVVYLHLKISVSAGDR